MVLFWLGHEIPLNRSQSHRGKGSIFSCANQLPLFSLTTHLKLQLRPVLDDISIFCGSLTPVWLRIFSFSSEYLVFRGCVPAYESLAAHEEEVKLQARPLWEQLLFHSSGWPDSPLEGIMTRMLSVLELEIVLKEKLMGRGLPATVPRFFL